MKISIVTVVLNDAVGLKKTAESLENQSCTDFEWIVIDGGSSDGGVDLIKDNVLLSPLVISEIDDGIYDAMNKGIANSRFEYIMFMNAGDTFAHKHVIKNLLGFVNRFCLLDVILGGTYQKIQNCVYYRPPKNIRWIFSGLPSFHQSIVFRTSLLKSYPYNLGYPILSDYEWLARQCTIGIRVGYLNCVVSNYSVGGASYTNLWQKFKDAYKVKSDVLGCSALKSFVSSGFVVVKTMFVMMVLYRICLCKTMTRLNVKNLVDIDTEFYQIDKSK